MTSSKLPPWAAGYLEARGITAAAARKRGVRVLEPAQTKVTFLWAAPAILFQYFSPDGKPLRNRGHLYGRARIFPKLAETADASKEKPPKFLQPVGSENHLYLDPARRDWPRILADPSDPLNLAEGETRAIAATKRGLVCVSLGGVWSWKTKHVGVRGVPLPNSTRSSGRPEGVPRLRLRLADEPDVRVALKPLPPN